MKKGLLLTLVMVAIALSGYRAMGRAPIVQDVKDIVVGDEHDATPANTFVYPNAIDLNAIVDDPDGSDDAIIWSFYEPSGTYLINGVPSVADITSGTVIAPPDANEVAGGGSTHQDPADSDSPYTATVRNATLSPIGGPNVDPGAATPPNEAIAGSAKTITLFASDGATIGMTEFIAYTANDQDDHTSPAGATPIPCVTYSFPNTTSGWLTKAGGGAAFPTLSNAICLEVPATGQNDAEWQGPYGLAPGIDLVANSVYRCRITARNQANAAETVPMWMFLFDNGYRTEDATAGRIAANAYAGEFVFLDAPGQGSANTVGVTRTNFECWIAPACVQSAAWNDTDSGGVATAADAYNDIRLRFRVFDLDGLNYGAETDLGRVCLESVMVDRYVLADLTRGTVAYDKPITLTGADRWTASYPSGKATTTDSGGVTVTPVVTGSGASAVGWGDGDVIQLYPGDDTWGDYSDAQLGDDFPIVWTADKLYLIEVVMSAPGPAVIAGMQNPGDVIRLGMDCPTNEMAVMNMVDANSLQAAGAGATSAPALPKSANTTFTALFFTHNVSNVPVVSARRLRPRIDMLNGTGFVTNQGPGGLDPTKFVSCKVTELSGF